MRFKGTKATVIEQLKSKSEKLEKESAKLSQEIKKLEKVNDKLLDKNRTLRASLEVRNMKIKEAKSSGDIELVEPI